LIRLKSPPKLKIKTARKARNPTQDSFIVDCIKAYRELPFMQQEGGHRILKHYLNRDYQLKINHKRLYWIMRENNLLIRRHRKKQIRMRKIAVDTPITRPNQLWQFDIKYGYIHGENKFFFVCAFIDVFTRDIMGLHIGLRCTANDILTTLKHALITQRIDETDGLRIRSDNGPQMTSYQFARELKLLPASHEFIPTRSPNQNAFIESFFSLLEINVMSAFYIDSYAEAYQLVVEFVDFYRNFRIHGSLKMSPTDFVKQYYATEMAS